MGYDNENCGIKGRDYGPKPYVLNVHESAMKNTNFRLSVWTGCNLQMTLMDIPVCGDIGWEIHGDTDQFIRIEHGMAKLLLGECKGRSTRERKLCAGDAVFIPEGTWHNIVNTGRMPLKVSSIYAPPHHPHGTVEKCKEKEDYCEM